MHTYSQQNYGLLLHDNVQSIIINTHIITPIATAGPTIMIPTKCIKAYGTGYQLCLSGQNKIISVNYNTSNKVTIYKSYVTYQYNLSKQHINYIEIKINQSIN